MSSALGGGPWTKQVALPNDFVQIAAGVPSGTSTLSAYTRGLLVGVAGTLNVTMANGEQRNLVPMQAGINPGRFAEVRDGGTAENVWEVT